MCGNVGAFGLITPQVIRCFEDLLNLDLQRGVDSTGIAFIKADTLKTEIVKDIVLPYELMRSKEYYKAINSKLVGMIGHNRAATRGNISADNAHPFKVGNITLVHNGTLHNQTYLPDHTDYDTDSENIAHAINKLGIEEAWKVVHGPATIVYWNEQEATLNFISNGERPFHWCVANNGKTLIWSSEIVILRQALEWAGITPNNKGEIVRPISDRLYTINVGRKGGLAHTKTDLVPFSYKEHWKNSEWWPKKDTQGGQSTEIPFVQGKKSTHSLGKNGSILTSVPNEPKKISEKEFHYTYKNCVFCNIELTHEYEDSTILDGRSAACKDCSEQATIHEIRLL